MTVLQIILWLLALLGGLFGIYLLLQGLRLELNIHKSTERQQLEEYVKLLNDKLDNRYQVREQVLKQKEQFEQGGKEVSLPIEGAESCWCIDDFNWRIDDLDWTIDDLKANIRNTKFEIDYRTNIEMKSKATYRTVLGAALFALAGLVLSLYNTFQ